MQIDLFICGYSTGTNGVDGHSKAGWAPKFFESWSEVEEKKKVCNLGALRALANI